MAALSARSITRPATRSRRYTASDSTSGSSGTYQFCLAPARAGFRPQDRSAELRPLPSSQPAPAHASSSQDAADAGGNEVHGEGTGSMPGTSAAPRAAARHDEPVGGKPADDRQDKPADD